MISKKNSKKVNSIFVENCFLIDKEWGLSVNKGIFSDMSVQNCSFLCFFVASLLLYKTL